MKDQRIIVADTETTATVPAMGSQMWEFAAVVAEPGEGRNDRGHYLHYYLPVDLASAVPKALEVGRFWERMPEGVLRNHVAVYRKEEGAARSDEEIDVRLVARTVARFLNGATIVGSNPGFDVGHIDEFLVANGATPTQHYRPFDLYDHIAGGLLVMGRQVDIPVSRTKIMRLLGVEQPKDAEHTALGDCRREIEVMDTWVSIVHQYRESPDMRLPGEQEPLGI